MCNFSTEVGPGAYGRLAPVLHTLDDLKAWRKSIGPREVIWTNGCFDLFHLGHADFLHNAKMIDPSAVLIVGVNSDASVTALKGKNRPILPIMHRVNLVSYHRAVDAVVIFDSLNPSEYIAVVKPTWVVKDKSFSEKGVLGSHLANKGAFYTRFMDVDGLCSTTNIISKIVQTYTQRA